MDFAELLDRLRTEDEVTLLELLELTSEDLVDNFTEKITASLPRILRHFDD